ncbi:MAG: hypothetical protein H6834_04975 [Planctomycetes bacterium]|nr:hypothetical protein [Planctomycetota bacterium]
MIESFGRHSKIIVNSLPQDTLMKPFMIPLLFLSTLSPTFAQTMGPFTAYPLALNLAKDASQDEILIKASGDAFAAPIPYPIAPPFPLTLPDYRMVAMFPNPVIRDLIDIDAFSTGNDAIPVDPNGLLNPDLGGGWAMLAFSVTHGSQGELGTVMNDRHLATGGFNGSDVYAHYVAGSGDIDPSLVGMTVLELTNDQIGIPGVLDDIEGVDFQLPQIVANLGSLDPEFLNDVTHLYFSITTDSAERISENATAAAYFPTGSLSGATIFEIEWDPATLTWGQPVVTWWPLDLGLAYTDDIDALTHDPWGATIFSTKNPTLEEFRVRTSTGNVTDLRGPISDGPVRIDIGLRAVDSVDGACGIDPDLGNFGRTFATPLPNVLFSYVMPMTFSVSPYHDPRAIGRIPIDRITMVLDGWGDHGPRAGMLSLELFSPVTGISTIGTAPRAATDKRMQFEIPVGTGLFGLEMLFFDATWTDVSYIEVLDR